MDNQDQRQGWLLIDAFTGFLRIWREIEGQPLARQIEGWEAFYRSHYPELLDKQIRDYASQGLDWRRIAAERIFPHLAERMSRMEKAHEALCSLCGSIYAQAIQTLEVELDVVFVIHLGLGCGAGWATRYQGKPACLLGLENIAECGWHTPEKLEGLLAHELGHLIHARWRDVDDLEALERDNPWFQLYTEGFAQRCEHIILGRESWHQAEDEGWLAWCRAHQAELAEAFLDRAEKGEPVSAFFGSWFEFQGQRQTGYFLGHECIRWLEQQWPLSDIARMPDGEVSRQVRRYLEIARQGGREGQEK